MCNMTKHLTALLTSRFFQFVLLPLAVLAWFVLTDPSQGADTALRLQLWAQALLVTGLAYTVAKALLGSSSSEALYKEALAGNTAAGLAYIGVCLMRVGVLAALLMFFAKWQ
jgi:hypothetical protein